MELTKDTPSQQMPKKADAAFSLFGKIVLIILFIGILVAGGYYLGTYVSKPKHVSVSPTEIPTTAQAQVSQLAQITPSVSQAMPPIFLPKKMVTAGLSGSTIFSRYTVAVPSGWTNTHESNSTSDKLVLSKDGYSLTINQAAFGGGGCVYKGDPPAEMAQTFSNFIGITGTSAQYRRGWNVDGSVKTILYTVCQQDTDKSFGSITSFGRIDAMAPNPPDETVLAEMDSIISSLVKQ